MKQEMMGWQCHQLRLTPDRLSCHHLITQIFYRPDTLSDAQPTVSKQWRHYVCH